MFGIVLICMSEHEFSSVPFESQDNSQNAPLVGSTLETLLRFLNWIPLGYIFETKLITTLIYKVGHEAVVGTEIIVMLILLIANCQLDQVKKKNLFGKGCLFSHTDLNPNDVTLTVDISSKIGI